MPRYGYGQGADPTELQQLSGNPFYNPTSPNPDWVRGLQYLYANLQGAKDKKKSEQQEAEDREWQKLARILQKTEAEQGIQQKQQELKNYVSPGDKEKARLFTEGISRFAEHKNRLAEIEAQGKQTRTTNLARPTKTPTELNDDYLSDVADVEKQYASMEVAARGELQKATTALVNNRFLSPDTFDADVKAAQDQYKEYIDIIAKKKDISLRAIDERYSDLPRARLSQKRRGKPSPAPAPAPAKTTTVTQEIQTKGKVKRAQVGKNPIKVGPDGKKYTKINGEIYEVID